MKVKKKANDLVSMSDNGGILNDLEFLPDWARRPAGLKETFDSPKLEREGLRDREGLKRRRDNRRDRSGSSRGRRDHATENRRRDSYSARPRAPIPDSKTLQQVSLPVNIFFIPERVGLQPVAVWLAGTRKAHALAAVASMFLSKPDYFAVKLESSKAPDGAEPVLMYQCALCKKVLLDKHEMLAHVLDRHMSDFYKMEEVVEDPPKGNFLCVAQCQLSGELLGPPNYHGYNERVLAIQRTRFPTMSLDDYRKHIVNKTDQDLIEKWKEDIRKKHQYSTVQAKEQEVLSNRQDVETHFLKHHATSVIREGRRFITPGVVSLAGDGNIIEKAVRLSWERESRFPVKIGVALQAALRHQGLFVFKAAGRIPFVTAIRPNPLVASRMETGMKTILELLVKHPGCGRRSLVSLLMPDAAEDSPEAAEIISRLCWLIERGHVIEFSDGRLDLPSLRNGGKGRERAE